MNSSDLNKNAKPEFYRINKLRQSLDAIAVHLNSYAQFSLNMRTTEITHFATCIGQFAYLE